MVTKAKKNLPTLVRRKYRLRKQTKCGGLSAIKS